jgi:type I restriction enzyme S subunit
MIETKFKQGELCAIPTDWAEGRFCDFLQTFSSGATPYRGNPRNYIGSIPWISSGELNYNVITDTLEHISENAQKQTNLKLHKPGTFLMAITGLEAAGTRGKCAFVGVPATTNQSCMAINGTDKMDTSYLYWFYRFWSETLAFKFCQGTKQQSYTAAIVKSLPIYTPDNIVEQQRIASALTSVDNLLSSLDKLIAKKRDIKQGAMQQLLTGKTRLKGFTEPWVYYSVGSDCCVKARIGWQGLTTSEYLEHGEYGLITSTDIVNYKVDWQTCCFVSEYRYAQDPNIIVQNGDVLISKDGTIGKVGIVSNIPFPCTLNSGVFVIRSKSPQISQEGLGLVFLSPYFADFIKRLTAGSTIVHLYQKDIVNFTFPMPPTIKEQQAIAAVLSSMDNEIAALEAKRKKYEAVKQGMMQQLLTGKIRLINQ